MHLFCKKCALRIDDQNQAISPAFNGSPCQFHDFSPLPGERKAAPNGFSSLFANTSDALKEVIKKNPSLGVLALVASKPEDAHRVESLARLVPQTKARQQFEQAGWRLDDVVVLHGSAVFMAAIRCSSSTIKEQQEGEAEEVVYPVPYLIKFNPTANELMARDVILARLRAKKKKKKKEPKEKQKRKQKKENEQEEEEKGNTSEEEEELLKSLVPTQVIEVGQADDDEAGRGNKTKVLAMPQFPRTLAGVPSSALSEAHVLHYIEGVYSCLRDVLWELQVFHCDIKPANLFLNARGRVMLGDFGSSQFAANISHPATTPLFVPVELGSHASAPVRSGVALDAGNLLSTIAELLGWWNHPEKETATAAQVVSPLSVRSIEPRVEALRNAGLKAIMLDLIAKVLLEPVLPSN